MTVPSRTTNQVGQDRFHCIKILEHPARNKGTEGMMLAAAKSLGEHSLARTDPISSLLPGLRDARRVAQALAAAVGVEAQRAGVTPKTTREELSQHVAIAQWNPEYSSFVNHEGTS